VSKKRKPPPLRAAAFIYFVSISRILSIPTVTSELDSYLSAIVVANNLKRHFRLATDTALHRSKGLVVALPSFNGTLQLASESFGFRLKTSLFAPRPPRSSGSTKFQVRKSKQMKPNSV